MNFFLIVGTLMNWLFGSIITFQMERDVFLREQYNNMYNPVAYFIAKNMVEVPAIIIAPMLQLLVIYWGAGYIHFLRVYLVMFLTANTSLGVGLLVSAMSPSLTAATSIAPAFTMPFILFGGLFANTDSMPKWLSWMQWISPVRYANEALGHT